MFRTNFQQKKPFSNKPPRLMSEKYLTAELDALTRLILHLIESTCFTCGTTKELQVGHLFERRHRHTRWDVHETGNNHLQCCKCNAYHEPHPEKYRDMFVIRFGERAFDDVATRAHSNQKLTYNDLLELHEGKTAILDRLRSKAS